MIVHSPEFELEATCICHHHSPGVPGVVVEGARGVRSHPWTNPFEWAGQSFLVSAVEGEPDYWSVEVYCSQDLASQYLEVTAEAEGVMGLFENEEY